MKPVVTLLLVLGLLLAAAGSQAYPTSPRPRRPAPAKQWRGFGAPAYLPARLPRPPRQHVLDSLASVARRRHFLTGSYPTR